MQVLTRDSVTVTVDAVVYYRVSNPTMVSHFRSVQISSKHDKTINQKEILSISKDSLNLKFWKFILPLENFLTSFFCWHLVKNCTMNLAIFPVRFLIVPFTETGGFVWLTGMRCPGPGYLIGSLHCITLHCSVAALAITNILPGNKQCGGLRSLHSLAGSHHFKVRLFAGPEVRSCWQFVQKCARDQVPGGHSVGERENSKLDGADPG